MVQFVYLFVVISSLLIFLFVLFVKVTRSLRSDSYRNREACLSGRQAISQDVGLVCCYS